MATLRERTTQEVVEHQCGAIVELMRLKNHRTVQTNPTLLAAVDQAWQSIIHANALACVVWFERDSLGDVIPFLPPPTAA